MTSKQTGHLLDQGHSDPKCWTTMFQNVKENSFNFRLKVVWFWKSQEVKDFDDVTLVWEDGRNEQKLQGKWKWKSIRMQPWSGKICLEVFLIKKQIREAEKQSVVGISRMNWIAWLISEISSRMKNDLQTYSDQMKYCDHCLVCKSLLNVNGI